MEQILLPLVTAMLKDMQERDRGRDEAHRETINNVQQARSTEEEGTVRGGNGAASKGRPDRHRHRFLRGDMALPGPFPGRVPEGWVGLDRRHQERPLDRGALIAISALTLLLFAAFALRDAARTAEQKSATEAEES
jgi:hypothetical protein